MAGQTYNFDAQHVARIAAAIRAYERTAGQGGPGRAGAGPQPTVTFWVKLTAESTANPGQYQWAKYVCLQGTWQASTPAASDATNYSAQEANATSGLAGQIVKVEFAGYDASSNPLYVFPWSRLPKATLKFQVITTVDDTLQWVADDVRLRQADTSNSSSGSTSNSSSGTSSST